MLYTQILKITLAAVLQRLYRRQNSRIQDCVDAKIKEKIDEANITNVTGTIPKALHDFILVCANTGRFQINNQPNIRLNINCDLLLKPNSKTVLNFK